MRHSIIVALATLPSIANAQVSSSTSCWGNGPFFNCSTQTLPNYMDNFNRGIEGMQRQLQEIQNEAERKKLLAAVEKARIAQSNRNYYRQRAGELVAAGNCSGARQVALAHGEFQLHSEIDAFCNQRDSTPQQSAPSTNNTNQTRVVPQGVLLNSRTDIGNGSFRCTFSNGFTRVIFSDTDCFKQ